MSFRYLIVILLVIPLACAQPPFQQGEVLYNAHCESCHMADGSGLNGLIPALYNSAYAKAQLADLPCLIRKGIDKNGMLAMPANTTLNPVQMANLVNYIQHKWGNGSTFVTLEQIKTQLDTCHE